MRAPLLLAAAATLSCGARSTLGSDQASDAGGSDVGLPCSDEAVATESDGAGALAVDGNTIFWSTGEELRVRDRGVIRTIAKTKGLIGPIALDTTTVYFSSGSAIFSCPRAGGSLATVLDHLTEDAVTSLAVDDEAIYVLEGTGNVGPAGTANVLRVDKVSGDSQTLIAKIGYPWGLALDDAYVYVTSFTQGTLLRVPKRGGAIEIVAQGLHAPSRLALDTTRVYFLENDDESATGGVRSVAKTGGPVTKIAEIPYRRLSSLAVDEKYAYVTTFDHENAGYGLGHSWLRRVALDGSSNEAWAEGDGLYGDVSSNGNAVYWTIHWDISWPPQDRTSVKKKCK